MIKIRYMFALLAMGVCISAYARQESMRELTDRVMDVATRQCLAMDSRMPQDSMPRTLADDGTPVNSNLRWWCSGFFPGTLWYVYENTGNEQIKKLALKNTRKLDLLQYRTDDHDIGFQIMCSYGNAYRLTGHEDYRGVIGQAAKSLCKRFNDKAGVIRSWDNPKWKFPVIIDNMMNLDLLMTASKLCGNKKAADVAKRHADTTIKNHFRDDFTTFHLVNYNPETGDVIGKQTVQGFADNSAWSRGQAWALYGYTMMHRHTGEARYLEQAERIADMLLKRLPKDGIPLWDFDAPAGDETRDASAAAIMASAFVDLADYTKSDANRKKYLAMAEKQIRSLASKKYLAAPGENGNFLLMHSTGNKAGNSEVDVPLTYADYYFLEAITRFNNSKHTK